MEWNFWNGTSLSGVHWIHHLAPKNILKTRHQSLKSLKIYSSSWDFLKSLYAKPWSGAWPELESKGPHVAPLACFNWEDSYYSHRVTCSPLCLNALEDMCWHGETMHSSLIFICILVYASCHKSSQLTRRLGIGFFSLHRQPEASLESCNTCFCAYRTLSWFISEAQVGSACYMLCTGCSCKALKHLFELCLWCLQGRGRLQKL